MQLTKGVVLVAECVAAQCGGAQPPKVLLTGRSVMDTLEASCFVMFSDKVDAVLL